MSGSIVYFNRIAILGAGSLGTILGAYLSKAGLDVTLIETIQCAGTAAFHQILGGKISEATGAQLEVIYYTNTTDAITDVLSGRIPAAVADIASYTSYVEAGQMRVLVGASDERWPAAPDVPTLTELGYEDCSMASYCGLAMPKGTDPAILELLREKFEVVANDPEFQERLYEVAKMLPAPMTGDEYLQLCEETYAENEAAVAETGSLV